MRWIALLLLAGCERWVCEPDFDSAALMAPIRAEQVAIDPGGQLVVAYADGPEIAGVAPPYLVGYDATMRARDAVAIRSVEPPIALAFDDSGGAVVESRSASGTLALARFEGGPEPVWSLAIGSAEAIAFAVAPTGEVAYDAGETVLVNRDGTERWRSGIVGALAFADAGDVIVVRELADGIAIDRLTAATGELVRSATIGGAIVAVAVREDHVVLADDRGIVFGFDLDGAQQWSLELGIIAVDVASRPGALVVAGSIDRDERGLTRVIARVDARTGELLDADESCAAHFSAIHRVVAASSDAYVELNEAELARFPW